MRRLLKDEGIIIRSRDFREADKIVTVYTKKRGKLRAVVKGVRKTKSRFGSLAELFTHGEFVFHKNPNKELYLVTQHGIINSFRGLREEIAKFTNASYISELADRFIEEGESNIEFWKLFILMLKLLELHPHLSELGLRFFEIKLLSLMGYKIDTNLIAGSGKLKQLIHALQLATVHSLSSLNVSSLLLFEAKIILLPLLHKYSETNREFNTLTFARSIQV